MAARPVAATQLAQPPQWGNMTAKSSAETVLEANNGLAQIHGGGLCSAKLMNCPL